MMKEDTMLETRRPKLDMLSESFIDQIVSEALDVLGKTGVLIENDSDNMSSFGLLVSNIVSSFIIAYHTLFDISYIIFDKNSGDFSGNGSRKSKERERNLLLRPRSLDTSRPRYRRSHD